jgi:hypothetical protein
MNITKISLIIIFFQLGNIFCNCSAQYKVDEILKSTTEYQYDYAEKIHSSNLGSDTDQQEEEYVQMLWNIQKNKNQVIVILLFSLSTGLKIHKTVNAMLNNINKIGVTIGCNSFKNLHFFFKCQFHIFLLMSN